MARFNYTVQDAQGTVTTGSMASEDEEQAVQTLQGKGLFILSIQSESEKAGSGLFKKRAKTNGKVPGKARVFFGEQLSTLIAGGVPLVRALSLLSEHSDSPALGEVLQQVTRDVSAGGSFHKALAKHPKAFGYIWVSLVQAGELSGQLPTVLRQITNYEAKQESIKGKIISAFSYPAVVLVGAMGVLVYFIIGIVPTFAGIFKDFGMQLPAITQIVVGLSDLFRNYGVACFVVLLGLIFGGKAYFATPNGKSVWYRMWYSAPLVGALLKDMALEQLITTMGTLVKSGVSILNTLSVLETTFKENPIFNTAIKKSKNEISSGRSIAESFKKTGIFPGMMTDMILMGEESGKLPDILSVLSAFYQERIDQFITRFSAMIDPILMVGIGAIAGFIVMSIFIPIFQMSTMSA